MITVTAAIIERKGLVLAARRKPGSHLAGFWEFPGGKLEPEETEQQCLARELLEEFDINCAIGDFFAESVYDYGMKIVKLRSYRVWYLSGTFKCRDHDQILWLPIKELQCLKWAPADLPLVEKLQEEYKVETTLAYYRDNANEYVQETIAFDYQQQVRQKFLQLLTPNSRILDLGCGSGRDSRFFLDHGHRIVAIDAVKEMAEQATQYLGQQVLVQKAEELSEIDSYDGIWACASLLHIPKSRINKTLTKIIRSLKPKGICFMSYKSGNNESEDLKQRFFNNYSQESMQKLLKQFPELRILDISESSSILRGNKQLWLNILVIKDSLPE